MRTGGCRFGSCGGRDHAGAQLSARICARAPTRSIVHIASLSGIGAYPNGGAYGVTKAALIALTKTMAMEWVKDGIRVNVVSPGTVEDAANARGSSARSCPATCGAHPDGAIGTA